MITLAVSISDDLENDSAIADDPLQNGYICEGSASGPTGASSWYDSSLGTDYGHGSRYAHEETYGMTLVKSKHD